MANNVRTGRVTAAARRSAVVKALSQKKTKIVTIPPQQRTLVRRDASRR